ncbi:MAG: hypothetical protein U5S82_02930 [Gammaproteobacteria bacterium]|nr:hypothetical protein [Gammaproteobacteria bacterium]
MNDHSRRLELSLLFLRLTVFLVMFMWTVDKFVNPGHAAAVFESFYRIPGLEAVVLYGIAAAEMVLLLLFVSGVLKTYTYGVVLVLHGISTLSSFKQYLAPFEGSHLLFFAAWPMLAACFALFVLRDEDRLWSLGKTGTADTGS